MTIMCKELTAEHIVSYGRKVEGNTVTIKFQVHPEIEKWVKEHNPDIVYSIDDDLKKDYIVRSTLDESYIPFKEQEIKSSKRDIENILKKHHIVLKLTKHQFKFMFPVFRKTPKNPYSKTEMEKLVEDGIWTKEIYEKNVSSV